MSDYDTLKTMLATEPAGLEAERLILAASELILEMMEQNEVTRSDLAERINKSKGHVSQLLNGGRNMTLRTLAELAHALGGRVELSSPTSQTSAVGRWKPPVVSSVSTLRSAAGVSAIGRPWKDHAHQKRSLYSVERSESGFDSEPEAALAS